MKRLYDAAFFLFPWHEDNEIPYITVLAWLCVIAAFVGGCLCE